MRTEHRVAIDAPPERVWSFLMDVPTSARCIPGVEAVQEVGDGTYAGTLRVGVGPIRLSLEGQVRVTARDDGTRIAALRVDAADKRLGGGVRADVQLAAEGSGPTTLFVASDVAVLGRVGELGQPLMKRKADQVMSEFAENVRRALTS